MIIASASGYGWSSRLMSKTRLRIWVTSCFVVAGRLSSVLQYLRMCLPCLLGASKAIEKMMTYCLAFSDVWHRALTLADLSLTGAKLGSRSRREYQLYCHEYEPQRMPAG